MTNRDKKLQEIIEWANTNPDVRAVLLTSSLVNPLAEVDVHSDLDIEFIFKNNEPYISDESWINAFGNPIVNLSEDESRFEGKHGINMVLYADHVKVDFKLHSVHKFLAELQNPVLHEDWDIGYKILLDKDGITQAMPPPSYQVSLIKKPSRHRFESLIHDFWWDTTYVAKCLARREIFYAKFMSENILRTEMLVPLLEWHIAAQNDWNVTTNKHGRYFRKYLTGEEWKKIQNTFSGEKIHENWEALFAMANLVHETGNALARQLHYTYPQETARKVLRYLKEMDSLYKPE